MPPAGLARQRVRVLATGAGNLAHVPELATGTVASPWPPEERERLIAEFSRAPQSRDLTSAVARFLPRDLVMLCADYLGTDPLRPGPLLFRRLLRDVIPTHLVLPARVAADVLPVIRAWAHWTADRADLPKRLRRRFLSELEDDLREFPRSRVEELIGLVGLEEAADRRAGGFSLGMGQRLGIAAALLGDPATLLLDEPVNGLDPEGIRWVRVLLKGLAAQGRTVFVSSHLMNEMAVTADHVIVVGRGRLMADLGVAEFTRSAQGGLVRVRTPEAGRLRDLLSAPGVTVSSAADGVLTVRGTPAEDVGEIAREHGIAIYELVAETATLEEAFMELTADAVEYRA